MVCIIGWVVFLWMTVRFQFFIYVLHVTPLRVRLFSWILPLHPLQRSTGVARDRPNRISVVLDASQIQRPLLDSYSAQTYSN